MRIILIILIIALLIVLALIRERLFVKSNSQSVDTKTRSRVVLCLRTIAVLLVMAFGVLVYKADYEITEITAYENGSYKLSLYEIGTPAFPFGLGKCRFILSENGRRIGSLDIELHNDGKRPGTENFEVSWASDSVSITVHGEEQGDAVYLLQKA